MRVSVLFLAGLVLSACAGSEAHNRVLESSGTTGVAPGAVPGEYVVTMRNAKDFGYDADDPAFRQQYAEKALAAQCPNGARMVGEQVINTGTYALGNPSRVYSVRVRCA